MKLFSRPGTKADQINIMGSAMSGDIVLEISPTTDTLSERATAWEKQVRLTLKNSAGKVHDWYNGVQASKASVADTSSAGTATIDPAADITFVNGVATVAVAGDAANWLNGTEQVETITVTAGAVTAAGDLVFRLTSTGMTGSPIDTTVAVAQNDTASVVAGKIRAALALDAVIAARFTIGGTGANIVLTRKVAAANDASLAMALQDADSTGVTVSASANTTAGVAPETATLTVANLSVLGVTVTGGTSVITVV